MVHKYGCAGARGLICPHSRACPNFRVLAGCRPGLQQALVTRQAQKLAHICADLRNRRGTPDVLKRRGSIWAEQRRLLVIQRPGSGGKSWGVVKDSNLGKTDELRWVSSYSLHSSIPKATENIFHLFSNSSTSLWTLVKKLRYRCRNGWIRANE